MINKMSSIKISPIKVLSCLEIASNNFKYIIENYNNVFFGKWKEQNIITLNRCRIELLYLNKSGYFSNKKSLLITHGDLDGVISAYFITKFPKPDYKFDIIFTQPFLLDRLDINFEEYFDVYITDIAINNKNPEMTANFIRKIQNSNIHLWYWYDHHLGWDSFLKEKEIDPYNFIIDTKAKACAELIFKREKHYLEWEQTPLETLLLKKYKHLCNIAIKSDTGQIQPQIDDPFNTENSLYMYLKLVTSTYTENTVINYFLCQIISYLNGSLSFFYDSLLPGYRKYKKILKNTFLVLLYTKQEISDKVLLIDSRKFEPVDKTRLFFEAYNSAEIVILLNKSRATNEDLITIATNNKNINLVKIFGLESGAPFRVTLKYSKEKLDEIIDILKKL